MRGWKVLCRKKVSNLKVSNISIFPNALSNYTHVTVLIQTLTVRGAKHEYLTDKSKLFYMGQLCQIWWFNQMEQKCHTTMPRFKSFIQTRYHCLQWKTFKFKISKTYISYIVWIIQFLDERSSVLISKDFTISDFTIPSDFELIIDDGVTIGTDLKISNCQGEDYLGLSVHNTDISNRLWR